VTLAVRTGVSQDVRGEDAAAALISASKSDRKLTSARSHLSRAARKGAFSWDQLSDGTLPPNIPDHFTWQETYEDGSVLALDEKNHRQVILNFFFTNDDEDLVTAKTYKDEATKVEDARRSCEVVKQIKSKGDKGHVGYQRIQDCYHHNLPDSATAASQMEPDDILYVVEEFAGSENLWDFIDGGEGLENPAISADIFKQVLQGLDFLETLDPVRVHHDLRPSNIWLMKDEDKEGYYYAFIRGFASSVEVTEEGKCSITYSDEAYSPCEYKAADSSCGENGLLNYQPSCGGAYDISSAAVIYLAIIWPETVYEDDPIGMIAGCASKYTGRPAFGLARFATAAKSKELAKCLKVEIDAKDPMSGIFPDVARALHETCWERPTAKELLTKKVKGWSKIKPKGVGNWQVA